MRRLLPFLLLMYVLAFLDRANIGFAQKALQQDTGLCSAAFAFGAAMFVLAAAPTLLTAFPIAVLVGLAIARGWAHGPLALVAGTIVWIGCVLLLLRGGAGVVDDLSRATGLLPNGLTGLSIEEATGMANPSASMLWAGRAIDAYFLVRGIIFGVLAVHYHTKRSAPDHR